MAGEELLIQSSWFLHGCIGQASTLSLRPYISQSDKWLQIYHREKAKYCKWLLDHLLVFLTDLKIKQVFKEKVPASYENFLAKNVFKRLAVIHDKNVFKR